MQGSRSSVVGERIHVTGCSGAGKSTLAETLARELGVPCVELDALNWLPDWVGLNATDPVELERRIEQATAGNGWVVAGSYTAFSQKTFWPRLQTLVWLDLPRWLLLVRVLRRSWHRSRSKQLLWGSNYERFWPQLKVWNKEDSLVWWVWTQTSRKRRQMVDVMADPRWAHIRVVRLTSAKEVAAFHRALAAE